MTEIAIRQSQGGAETALASALRRAQDIVTRDRVEVNTTAAYLASLTSDLSRATMEGALNDIAGILTAGHCNAYTCPWHLVRAQHSHAIRAELVKRWKPATANKKLCALRGVLKMAWRIGLMSAEDCTAACDVKAVKSEVLPRGRSLFPGEIRALFQSCADGTAGGRLDAALLSVMYGAGLRRSEAAALNVEDLGVETGELRILQGKGRKDRIAYLPSGALAALRAWINTRGEGPGALFCPVNKGGAVTIKRMTTQAIYNRLNRRAKMAGVEAFSPHDLRRSYCGDMLDAGADVSLVQKLMGHAKVTTTQRYDRRPERAKQEAAQLLHVPYVAT